MTVLFQFGPIYPGLCLASQQVYANVIFCFQNLIENIDTHACLLVEYMKDPQKYDAAIEKFGEYGA